MHWHLGSCWPSRDCPFRVSHLPEIAKDSAVSLPFICKQPIQNLPPAPSFAHLFVALTLSFTTHLSFFGKKKRSIIAYSIVIVSAVQHESAVSIHTSLPPWAPLPHAPHPAPQGHHRAGLPVPISSSPVFTAALLQHPGHGSNLNVHRQVNAEYTYTYIQRSITQA